MSIIKRGTYGIVSKIEIKDCINNTKKTMALKTTYNNDKKCYDTELDILLMLDHPNIINVHYYFYTLENGHSRYLNICSDYMEMSLFDLITRNKTIFKHFGHNINTDDDKINIVNKSMPCALIKHLYKQALKALNYLHSMNICHLDIKPGNILINKDFVLKICDFGSSIKLSNFKNYIPYDISLLYVPPEMLMLGKVFDTRYDIWALGLVFLELRYLKHLFTGNNMNEILINIMQKFEAMYDIDQLCFITRRNIDELVKMYFPENEIKDVILNSIRPNYFERKTANELIKILENVHNK